MRSHGTGECAQHRRETGTGLSLRMPLQADAPVRWIIALDDLRNSAWRSANDAIAHPWPVNRLMVMAVHSDSSRAQIRGAARRGVNQDRVRRITTHHGIFPVLLIVPEVREVLVQGAVSGYRERLRATA